MDYSDHEIALKTRQKMTNIRKESSMLLVGREGGISTKVQLEHSTEPA